MMVKSLVLKSKRQQRESISSISLFQQGDFNLHSGNRSNWKIDCDALTDKDWSTLAMMTSQLFHFSAVAGIPGGGLKLANKLQKYCRKGYPTLIVDDVLTTGKSMEETRKNYPNAIGVVVFARGECPEWITSLFIYNGILS